MLSGSIIRCISAVGTFRALFARPKWKIITPNEIGFQFKLISPLKCSNVFKYVTNVTGAFKIWFWNQVLLTWRTIIPCMFINKHDQFDSLIYWENKLAQYSLGTNIVDSNVFVDHTICIIFLSWNQWRQHRGQGGQTSVFLFPYVSLDLLQFHTTWTNISFKTSNVSTI